MCAMNRVDFLLAAEPGHAGRRLGGRGLRREIVTPGPQNLAATIVRNADPLIVRGRRSCPGSLCCKSFDASV